MKIRRKKKKLSPDEKRLRKIKSDHRGMVRSVFKDSGFVRYSSLSDREFVMAGQRSDFDDIYSYENVLVCCEYTTSQTSSIGDHLKPKKIVYDKIENDEAGFIDLLTGVSEELREGLLGTYDREEIVIRVVYCSLNGIEPQHKLNVPNPVYLDYANLRYFKNLTDCIKRSARYELLQFLKIKPDQLGEDGRIGVEAEIGKYRGSILPESSSNFEPGYKIVSFYIDPAALLRRAYVLRKDGWQDSHGMYQRLISKTKITSIRAYLNQFKRVFVNNIIVTLPESTKVVDQKGNTVDPVSITKTQPVTIQIPGETNSIGLIDGQHRTYSYYEAAVEDLAIEKLRKKQNLLVTGIIYPPGLTLALKEKFEARLFLEINSTQTNAKSELKQAIGLILQPFHPESIATRVLAELDSSSGPLGNQIQQYWFDKGKMKTTSIISFGLKPLVKTGGEDSLFSVWDEPNKDLMVENEDHDLLKKYIKFCVASINDLLFSIRINMAGNKWTLDKKIEGRLLTTINVNAFLICLRLIIQAGGDMRRKSMESKFAKIDGVDFQPFHSSQYARLAEAIYAKCFS